MSDKTVRVVVVDDSPTARLAIRAALETDPGITVVGEASNGDQALRLTRQLAPDLVTMDVYLKSGDGIEVTSRIMSGAPTAVVVVTSLDSKNPNLIYRAVEAGALEVMGKPPRPGTPTYQVWCRKFTKLVRALAGVHVIRRRNVTAAVPDPRRFPSEPAAAPSRRPSPPIVSHAWRALLIGASTGGPPTVRELLSALPSPMPLPIALVQHMMPEFVEGFARWLAVETSRRTQVVTRKVPMESNTVYVAPPDRHLEVMDGDWLGPVDGPLVEHQRPSVDRLFESGAAVLGSKVIAVLLTGMGRDGALGLQSLHHSGALTLVQEPESCVVAGMPRAAIELGAAGLVLPPSELAEQIQQCLHRGLE